MAADLQVLPSSTALAETAADYFVTAASEAIRARGEFVVALAGGETPRATYQHLATEALASQVKWDRVKVIWGDERCVPPADALSNYRMAREALLDHVPIPAANVHRIHGEDHPAAAAAAGYETMLRTLLQTPAGPPSTDSNKRIDLIFLGLGTDGHTASLFPGTAATREHTRWVMADYAAVTAMWRVTLTPVVINAGVEVLFLVAGAAKADVLRRVIEGPHRPEELPAQLIGPSQGRVRWFVDQAAARDLKKP